MAKVSFTKLGLKINQENTTIMYGEQPIEIKQYLPVNDKLTLISNVINSAMADDTNFINPLKVQIFFALEVMSYYTNINFTEKQKDDPAKLYDMLVCNGLLAQVINAISANEYETLEDSLWDSIEAIYAYKNSVMGIIETLSADYSNLKFDAENIQQTLANPENLDFLKTVLTKLG
jgi:hypothetical protein